MQLSYRFVGKRFYRAHTLRLNEPLLLTRKYLFSDIVPTWLTYVRPVFIGCEDAHLRVGRCRPRSSIHLPSAGCSHTWCDLLLDAIWTQESQSQVAVATLESVVLVQSSLSCTMWPKFASPAVGSGNSLLHKSERTASD